MGRLHDRMAEELRLRNFSPATQRNYLLYARRFAAFFMRYPEALGETPIGKSTRHSSSCTPPTPAEQKAQG